MKPKDVLPESYDKERKVAVITGATSGIGRSYAIYFASQGYDLIITGRRENLIAEIEKDLQEKFNIRVESIIADLSRQTDLNRLLTVLGKRSDIEILINNAGYGLNCAFSEDEIGHQLNMMKVHIHAPLMLIHKVLPSMIQNRKGVIINVSSLAANMPTANSAMYSGTKSFLKSFTESLYMDLSGYGIKLQCICPGFTKSDFHRNSNLKDNLKPFPWMTPEQVVEYSIYCLNKGQVICIPGFFYRALNLLVSVLPRKAYYLLFGKL